jgi:TatD DNase family protein
MYTNIHTHIVTNSNDENLTIYNRQTPSQQYKGRYSAGIHPWYIPDNPSETIEALKTVAQENNMVAIGECGLDKLCQTPFELQKEIFKSQINISEEYKKPLIIHCVKSYNEIVEIKKEVKPKQTWIIHGFRGKPEIATMLIKAGIVLSIGEKFNPETLRSIPIDKILIESDESTTPIDEIYKKIATTLNISECELIKAVEKTYKNIFR